MIQMIIVNYSFPILFFLPPLAGADHWFSDGPSPPDIQIQFNPSTAIIIFGIAFIFFFLSLLYIFVSQHLCARERAVSRRPGSRRIDGGLDPSVVTTFPSFRYSGVDKVRQLEDARLFECVVCLGEFREQEIVRLLPKCGHLFHLVCIDAWLANRTTCPLCRSGVDPDSLSETDAARTLDSAPDSERYR